jgi:glutathione S-transferase
MVRKTGTDLMAPMVQQPFSTPMAFVGAGKFYEYGRPGTFPNLAAHYERMMARPAVIRACHRTGDRP